MISRVLLTRQKRNLCADRENKIQDLGRSLPPRQSLCSQALLSAQHSLCSQEGPGATSSELQVCRVPVRSSCNSCSPWPSALPLGSRGSWSTQSQQQNPNMLAAACGFPTDIPCRDNGDKTQPCHLRANGTWSKYCMTKCLGASLLEKGLTVIWTLCRGAAAKETSLGTAWKSCCQKTETPEQCRCLEKMAGHSCPEIEKITFLVQSRIRKTSNKPIQVIFPSLQFIPATSAFARLSWHHSGLHLATDTLKCPQHKSYSLLQGRATRPWP